MGLILANGCPKSGTHALMSWLEVVGLERVDGIVKAHNVERGADRRHDGAKFIHAHVPYGYDVRKYDGVVTVIRDPRNVLLSYSRWAVGDISPDEAISDFFGRPFTTVYASYLGWIGNCTVVRYEDIVTNGRRVSIGSDTYTGNPSDWQKNWSDELDAACHNAGIHELAKRAGYE